MTCLSGLLKELYSLIILFSFFIIPSLQVPYFDLLVPTVDTVRFGFLLEKLVSIERSVLFTGMTGVGKVTVA